MQLITVDDLAAYLGQAIESREQAAVDAVDSANAIVLSECGSRIDDGAQVTVVVPIVGGWANLSGMLPTSVVSITVSGVDYTTYATIRGESIALGVADPLMAVPLVRLDVTGQATCVVRCGWSGPMVDTARKVALRIAARQYTNPMATMSYQNANYSAALPDMSGRLITPDERRILMRLAGTSVVFT